MSKALELAEKITGPKAGPWDNWDAAEELRRLAALEQAIKDAQPVAFMAKSGEVTTDPMQAHRWVRHGGTATQLYAHKHPKDVAHETTVQRDKLLNLLQELIDIEGPQPGTAAWASKARAAIAECSK
jgi:hypothetical protein